MKDYVNHVGEVHGKLTVLEEFTVKSKTGKITKKFNCVCACGEKYTATKFSVLHGISKQCKTCRYDQDYTKVKIGDKFNFLQLISEPIKTENGRRGNFVCDCGTVKSILVENVIGGYTKSCGCYNKQRLKDNPISIIKLPKECWEDVCNRYSNKDTVASIADFYKVSHDTIYNALELSGIKRDAKEDKSLRGKDVIIDRSRFTDMTCRDTAYYYGLLLADGCLTGRTKSTLLFSLKAEDSYMVENLYKWLSAPTKIYEKKSVDSRTGKIYPAVCLNITDKVVANNLRKLGYEERKSTKEKLPDVYATNPDFWRGMLDGDGHIGISNWIVNLCGSLEICEGFVKFCQFAGAKQNPKLQKTDNLSSVSFTNKRDVKCILDVLYKDTNLYLLRKYEVYKNRYLGENFD